VREKGENEEREGKGKKRRRNSRLSQQQGSAYSHHPALSCLGGQTPASLLRDFKLGFMVFYG
jgi:hypothetical protein